MRAEDSISGKEQAREEWSGLSEIFAGFASKIRRGSHGAMSLKCCSMKVRNKKDNKEEG